MRRTFVAIIAALFAFAAVYAGAQTRAVFKTVTGKVEIQAPGETAWTAATAGMEVPVRATISTGFGGGAVLDVGASTLTVRQLTRLRIDELTLEGKVAKTNLTMPVGRIRADVKAPAGATTDFKLRTPISTAAVRGTGFETDGSLLSVFQSIVSYWSQSGVAIDVHSGESGSTDGGGSPSGGAGEREANTGVNTHTAPTGTGGTGNGEPGLGTGSVTVSWQ